MDKSSAWGDHLLSKQGKIITLVAGDLLGRRAGDRIPAFQEYAARFETSAGTVQAAIDYLQAAQIAALESQGRAGTFLVSADYARLWSLTHNRPVVGALPLPYSRRLAGLATALRDAFAAQRVVSVAQFVRGSLSRLHMLHAGSCDWTVVSRYTAETTHGFNVQTVALLGAGTYTHDNVLLIRAAGETSGLVDGMRLGIDVASPDHAYVVRRASWGRRVTFVEIDYGRALDLLADGTIDATVWTRDDLPAALADRFHIAPLAPDDPAFAALGEAAIITQAGNDAVVNLLRALIDAEQVRAVQAQVVNYERVPSY